MAKLPSELKRIGLNLARSKEFSNGSARHGYEFIAPLDARAAQKIVRSPLTFARLLRANLMHKRRIDRLLGPEQPIPSNPNQLNLGLYFP